MRRLISCLLLLFLCLSLLPSLQAEAESAENTGSVHIAESLTSPRPESPSPEFSAPVIPDKLDRAVIGSDDRTTVSNVSQWPFSAIAYLEVNGECGCSWTASGFVGGMADTVITAAHCLVCPEHSSWAESLTLYFGYKSRKNYLYRYRGEWVAVVGDIFSDNAYSINNDWGIVKLKEDIAAKVGGFGIRYDLPDNQISSCVVNVSGYAQQQMKSGRGLLQVLDDNHIQYDIDMISGNSGCPIYSDDGYALGINIADSHDDQAAQLYNIGFRFNNAVREAIQDLQFD